MDNPIFAKLAPLGFTPVDQNNCVGTWKNYAVTLRRYSGSLYWIFVAIRIPARSKELKKTLKTALRAKLGKRAAVANVMPNFFQGQLRFSHVENELPEITAFLDTVTAALRENGVGPADTCAVTGAANPDSLCLLDSRGFPGFQPVCATAVRQEGYAAQARVEENENNGSYLTGAIGALLGMLVGVGVNLLTLVFLHRFYVILFALVPVAAMFGYKLFKGKTDKISIVIVIVLSVIAVPLMEFLTLVFDVMREYSAPFGEVLSWASEAFFAPEFTKQTIPEMLKMLLFMALGVFVAWSFMAKQTNSVQARGAQILLDTMRPNPNCTVAREQNPQPQAPDQSPE